MMRFLLSQLLYIFSHVIFARALTLNSEDYRVVGLEEIEPAFKTFDGEMFAGQIPTTLLSDLNTFEDSPGVLTFWLYAPTKPTHDDTIVIWMNGGPGCSSFSGCLFEHCPVTVPLHPAGFFGTAEDPKELFPNPYAWTNATMMLYVEQPHGTGFGYGPDPKNETDVGRDFYIFMENFYTVFNELIDHRLFIFGESYAGMYVPSIAWYIHQENKKKQLQRINLAGVGIGNGWIDGKLQSAANIDFLWWHGMIDFFTRNELRNAYDNCINGAPMEEPFHNFNTPDECGVGDIGMEAAGEGVFDWGIPNSYDVTTFDLYVTVGEAGGAIDMFYNNPAVQDALNIREHKPWEGCNGQKDGRDLLRNDKPLSMLPYISDLLDDAKIDVLVYNGDRDYLCNQPGSEMALNAMEWSGSKGWADTMTFDRGIWVDAPKSVGGFMKKYKNLNLLAIYNSGHMVPMNRPLLALDLVTRFLGGDSFIDTPLPRYKIPLYKDEKKEDETVLKLLEGAEDANKDSESIQELVEVGEMRSSHSFLYAVLYIIIGIVIGFVVSRKRPNKKNEYEELRSTELE